MSRILKKLISILVGILAAFLATAAQVSLSEATANFPTWFRWIPEFANWLSVNNLDAWGLAIAAGLLGFALGRSSLRWNFKATIGNKAAKRKLVAFWIASAREALFTLQVYFDMVRKQFAEDRDGYHQLTNRLLKNYVSQPTHRLINRVDKIEEMSFEEQQLALREVWIQYKRIHEQIAEITATGHGNYEESEEFVSWQKNDGHFRSNLSSLLSSGRFPILQAQVGGSVNL